MWEHLESLRRAYVRLSIAIPERRWLLRVLLEARPGQETGITFRFISPEYVDDLSETVTEFYLRAHPTGLGEFHWAVTRGPAEMSGQHRELLLSGNGVEFSDETVGKMRRAFGLGEGKD